jgi:DNA-binding XRE family transcriptional regulator
MADLKYQPVSHDHEAFLKNAQKREGFRKAYKELEEEYLLVREMLAARYKSGLTQEEVARLMGTTKSAVSRLESAGKHAPSLTTLKKYARAVDCHLEIKLVSKSDSTTRSTGRVRKRAHAASTR